MNGLQLNIGQVIGLILKIESDIKVPCLSYGLYDKANKEYITDQNKESSFDYYDTYENRCRFRYTVDPSIEENAIMYLLSHHGEIYFPMLKKNTQKAYVAQFDMDKLLELHGSNTGTTPDQYFKDKFCWKTRKSKTKQCTGQMVLQFN